MTLRPTLLIATLSIVAFGCIETKNANCAENPDLEVCIEACRRNPTDPACPRADASSDAAAADASSDAAAWGWGC